jgi:hypothetical protein
MTASPIDKIPMSLNDVQIGDTVEVFCEHYPGTYFGVGFYSGDIIHGPNDKVSPVILLKDIGYHSKGNRLTGIYKDFYRFDFHHMVSTRLVLIEKRQDISFMVVRNRELEKAEKFRAGEPLRAIIVDNNI